MRFRSLLVAAVLAAMVLSGCSGGSSTTTSQGGAPAPAQPVAPGAGDMGAPPGGNPGDPAQAGGLQMEKAEATPAKDPAATFVTVNGKVITFGQLEQEIQRALQSLSGRFPVGNLDQLRPLVEQQARRSIVDRHLIETKIAQSGVTVSPEDITAEIERVKSRFASPEEFDSQLQAAGMTVESMRENLAETLRVKKLLEASNPGALTVTAEDARKFYDENPSYFGTAEEVQASHILVKVDAGSDEAAKKAAKEKIDGILAKVKGGGDFAQLARENSDCPSKEQGGDLGFFGKGRMVPEFEQAAFGMKVGDTSDVVETQFGYHIIRVTDHHEPKVESFDEVKGQIEESLVMEKVQSGVQDLITELRATATIEYAPGEEPQPQGMPGGPGGMGMPGAPPPGE